MFDLLSWTHHNYSSSPPGQNGHLFAANNFKCILMNETFHILIEISLKFIPTSHYLNQCWPDSLTHIGGTRGKWVNLIHKSHNTPVPYPTMHHSEQKCVFLFWMVHYGIWNRWTMGFVKLVYLLLSRAYMSVSGFSQATSFWGYYRWGWLACLAYILFCEEWPSWRWHNMDTLYTPVAPFFSEDPLGPDSIKRCHLTSKGNPIMETRWLQDRRI